MPVEPQVTKAQSITSTQNRNIEIFSLTPSTLITLWEIDASVVMDEAGLKLVNYDYIFRFHNSVHLTTTAIYWRSQKYWAAPIQAQGFEYTAKGSPPTPKLTLAVNEEGVEPLALLKTRLQQIGDLAGAKVTRRRVFAKYIDGINFPNLTRQELAGQGFSPDPNMQFEPDIYYIDRKSLENKAVIEFELASIIDIEGIQLPGRIVSSKRCPFQYRGWGCLYESNANRQDFIHGESSESTLPVSAPPVANEKDELISDILGAGTKIEVIGEYKSGTKYNKGNAVWVQKDGIKYYFVAKQDNTTNPPPNPIFWINDSCSKSINGCRLRWADLPGHDGTLPFGGFASVLTTI